MKCDENLQRICIDSHLDLMPFCKEIENFLRKVEIVQFVSGRGSDQDEVTFLKYCPNVSKIVLKSLNRKEKIAAILQQKYHQLTHFLYIYDDPEYLDAEKWKIFIQINEKIQCVALQFDHCDDARDYVPGCIQTLLYAPNLKHLFLAIDNDKYFKSVDVICSHLKVLGDRDPFKLLELKFESEGIRLLQSYAHQLANLKQLTKLHLNYLKLSDAIPALRSLVHLKIISLEELCADPNWSSNWPNFNELIDVVDRTQNMDLPRIEEVYVEDIKEGLLITLVMLVRHWKNLKRIHVPVSDDYYYKEFRIAEHISKLDRTRQKLKGACELTIFTDDAESTTVLEHKLVKLKVAKFSSFDSIFEGHSFQRYNTML